MVITTEAPIKAGYLPKEVRGNIDPDQFVKVSVETVSIDESQLDVSEETAKALDEAEKGIGLSEPFQTKEALFKHLDNL